jgi:hypothetical protein
VQTGALVEKIGLLCWRPDVSVFDVKDDSSSFEVISFYIDTVKAGNLLLVL